MLRKTMPWTQFCAKQCRWHVSIELQSWLEQRELSHLVTCAFVIFIVFHVFQAIAGGHWIPRVWRCIAPVIAGGRAGPSQAGTIQSWLGQQKDKEKQKNGASAELAEFEGRRERRTLSCSS